MSFYRDYIYPRLVDKLGDPPPIRRIRRQIIPRAEGTVLEIGVGSGANFIHYDPTRVIKLYALEPNPGMIQLAERRRQRTGLNIECLGLPGERIPLGDRSVDTIVSTFTLCTISDIAEAIRGLQRVLRPGGKLIFFELGVSPDPEVKRWQQRLEPIHQLLFQGLYLTRDIPSLIRHGGFRIVELQMGYMAKFPKSSTYCCWGFQYPSKMATGHGPALLPNSIRKPILNSIAFRAPGTQATLRGVGAKVLWAYPTTVVKDTSDLIALYLPAGAVGKDTEHKPAPQELLSPDEIRIVDCRWERTDVLMLIVPGQAFSTYLMWETGTRILECWYINLQEPIRRTSIGFDTMDHMLDVVVTPDMSAWEWKDADEFAEAERIGFYSRQKAGEIWAEGEKAVRLLTSKRREFYKEWEGWQANPAWEMPRLSSHWNKMGLDADGVPAWQRGDL